MYRSPDRFQRMVGARLPGGQSLGAVGATGSGAANSPMSDLQLISRGHFAAYFAGSNIVGCGLLSFALWASVSLPILLGWAAAVVAVNVGAMQWARHQSVSHVGRSGRPVPTWALVGETAVRALAILSLPVFSFSALSPDAQLVTTLLLTGLGVASVGLIAVPACVLTWFVAFVGATAYAIFVAREAFPLQHILPLAFTAGVAVAGIMTIARWGLGQMQSNAEVGSQSEGAALLLEEYEQRGVGWLWQVDHENRVTYISNRMSSLLGRTSSAIVGHTLPSIFGGHAELGRMLFAKQPFHSLELQIDTKAGARWFSVAGDPIVDTAGRFEGFRGVGMDITEVRETQERLTHLANVDVLSGLPNRGRVRQLLGDALRTATQDNIPCAILFLDLDGFKPVNDTFGHPKGDAVLLEVARRLSAEVGGNGHVGRMGGDEFAIVVGDAQSRTGVEGLCHRILEAIARPYAIEGTEIRIGVSIGGAYGPIDGATVDDLILKADLALYEAKNSGKGTARFFSSQLQSEQDDRVRIEADLRKAIAGNQFFLVYQPLVDAKQQKLVGFEALIRWQHPDKGLVPPFKFIPLAEELGLMGEIGDWVIGEAIRAAATWPDHIFVALNISPKQIVFPALPNTVSRALAKHKVAGNRIELEVTEGVFLGANAQTLDTLNRLRHLGCGIALDDFGTGYSSIGYLNKAVFHKLKIDGSFVREAGTRPENVAIIESIVQLARSFRMTVTAEGVETVEDFERMRQLGVDTIQGYLFGKPLTYDKANELVRGYAGTGRQSA